VGWHTFRHTVGTVLAELGEHQLTIRDYLRHSNLSVTNKYLQAASHSKRNAQARLVEAIVPVHLLPAASSAQAGGDDGTRTRGLCRVRALARCI
jgi:hypothetical protein